jgi:hypothetical protein
MDDFSLPANRLAAVSIVGLLALRCVRSRLSDAGLAISESEHLVVLDSARLAFDELAEDAERIEEFNLSFDRLGRVWETMTSRIKDGLDARAASVVFAWIAMFQKFLRLSTSVLAINLLRLRTDPTYKAGVFPPQIRQALIQKASEEIVPLVTREDAKPDDQFDRRIYSYWIDAGNPVNVLDQFISATAAERVVSALSVNAPHDIQRLLEKLGR